MEDGGEIKVGVGGGGTLMMPSHTPRRRMDLSLASPNEKIAKRDALLQAPRLLALCRAR